MKVTAIGQKRTPNVIGFGKYSSMGSAVSSLRLQHPCALNFLVQYSIPLLARARRAQLLFTAAGHELR